MYHVAAKNLETRHMDVYTSNLFFIINEENKWYKLFAPTSAKDFDPDQYYGQRHGKYCVLFRILDMSGKSNFFSTRNHSSIFCVLEVTKWRWKAHLTDT